VTTPGVIHDEYFEHAGLRFHYLDSGDSANPTVVLLHGGGLTAHTWDRVCALLSSQYRCVALDQRGHGDSDWSQSMDYEMDDYISDIAALSRHLGVARFVLAGMSLGAFNSLGYALRYEATLTGLVLIDIAPQLAGDGLDRLHGFMDAPAVKPTVEDFVAQAMSFNPRRNPEVLRTSLLHNLRQTPDGGWTWKYDRRPRLTRQSPEGQAARAVLRAELWDRGRGLSCPTLVVRGADSDVTDREVVRSAAAGFRNARFAEIPDAGHTVQGDNPAGLSQALLAFLSELDLVGR
jgi:esterase